MQKSKTYTFILLLGDGEYRVAGPSSGYIRSSGQGAYHLRPRAGCIRAGDTDGEGLVMVIPVAGLTIGMALRARVAEGWWSLMADCCEWNAGGMKGGEDELSEKVGAIC